MLISALVERFFVSSIVCVELVVCFCIRQWLFLVPYIRVMLEVVVVVVIVVVVVRMAVVIVTFGDNYCKLARILLVGHMIKSKSLFYGC